MRAGGMKSFVIIVKSCAITLWISIRTLFEAYTGRFTRELGDRRLRWWSSRLLDYVGAECHVHDSNSVSFEPGVPYVLMCNHRSLYDIPITFVALPGSIRMLTKKELFRVPLWGRGMRAGEFISIDRQNRQQAFRDLDEAKAKMASGIIVWVAPEGTRARSAELLPFKKGPFRLAHQANAVIVPIGIRGSDRILAAKTLAFSTGERIDVHVGVPIDASCYGERELEALMADVRAQLEQLGGYVATRRAGPRGSGAIAEA
jgi:1-acyl-sn-glycerol-3-phosphate acyltransferase